jgi:hypothetical protein
VDVLHDDITYVVFEQERVVLVLHAIVAPGAELAAERESTEDDLREVDVERFESVEEDELADGLWRVDEERDDTDVLEDFDGLLELGGVLDGALEELQRLHGFQLLGRDAAAREIQQELETNSPVGRAENGIDEMRHDEDVRLVQHPGAVEDKMHLTAVDESALYEDWRTHWFSANEDVLRLNTMVQEAVLEDDGVEVRWHIVHLKIDNLLVTCVVGYHSHVLGGLVRDIEVLDHTYVNAKLVLLQAPFSSMTSWFGHMQVGGKVFGYLQVRQSILS